MSDKGAPDDDIVDCERAGVPVDNAHADAPKVRPVGSSQRVAIIREFISDVRIPDRILSRNVFEVRGYLPDRLRL